MNKWSQRCLFTIALLALLFPEALIAARGAVVQWATPTVIAVMAIVLVWWAQAQAFSVAMVSVCSHGYVRASSFILQWVSTITSAVSSWYNWLLSLPVKVVPGLTQVTHTTYAYSYWRNNVTATDKSTGFCLLETGFADCSHYLFDKPEVTVRWEWAARNILPPMPQFSHYFSETNVYRLFGTILVLISMWQFVSPIVQIGMIRSYKMLCRFLIYVGYTTVETVSLAALPYRWAVNLKEKAALEWNSLDATIQVAPVATMTLEDRLIAVQRELAMLRREGGLEIKQSGSEYVNSPQTGLIQIVTNNGEHVGMGFIGKLWNPKTDKLVSCFFTAKHAANSMRTGFGLKTGKMLAAVPLEKFSFLNSKPVYRSATLDAVAYKLEARDGSYLIGAKHFTIGKTPTAGSTVTVHGMFEGRLKQSFGVITGMEKNMLFTHNCSTESGFSGTPLIYEGTVVGIHAGFKGAENLGVQLDHLVKRQVFTMETIGDYWKMGNLRQHEDDIVLTDEPKDEDIIDEYDLFEERYYMRERDNFWRVDAWADDDEEMDFDNLPDFDFRGAGMVEESRTIKDFRKGATSAHQASQDPHTGGLVKIAREMKKYGKSPRVKTYGSQVNSNVLKAVQSHARWAQVKKSGRNIPASLAGIGYQDLVDTSDDRLDCTLIDLAEVLGLRTASFKTYWSTHLLNLDSIQKRRLLKTWSGILNESGFLPLADRK